MSFLNLEAIRRHPLPPVATGVTALIVVLGLVDTLARGAAYRWLGLWLGGGPAALVQFWRPVTFGVVAGSLFSALFAALFCYWIVSGAERQWGSVATGLVALGTVLTVAAVASWFIPLGGIIPGASYIAWGTICAQTYWVWRRGDNVRDQLILLAICAMLNIQGGSVAIMLSLAATVGGIAMAHVLWELKLPSRKPADPYDAYRRARQGKGAPRSLTNTTVGIALCAVLYLLWALRHLLG